jgi:flagellar hook-associated protein 1
MLGLFGTLNLGARSLATQRQGVETAGQNLANVNNTAYARQRVQIQTSLALPSTIGPIGTGASVVAIQQLRDTLLDRQITSETSVGGFLEARQRALQYGQAALGEEIDTTGSTDASGASLSTSGLADQLNGLFNQFQNLSTNPTSLSARQALLAQAQGLAARFQDVNQKLSGLSATLDDSISSDVGSANQLLSDIASLNDQIQAAEFGGGSANDLRDLRQQKIEGLAKLVNLDATPEADGSVNLSIGGQLLVSGKNVLDTLQTYDAGGGQMLVRTASNAAPLTLTSGSIQGAVDARDGTLADLQGGLDTLASLLINQVNTVHAAGFSLTGSTGAAFFTGTGAADIAVNTALVDNPALLQASGTAGATGDNQVALALAQLSDQPQAALNGQSFSEDYSAQVATFGQALADAQTSLSDHKVVGDMLESQRQSVSGVSIDEEMTSLLTFQKAFEASARLITTVDEMLDTVVNLKR